MKQYNVQLSCGCCDAILNFENESSIQKAFQLSGLSSNAIIVDDNGVEVEGVDTFYGYREIIEG